MNSWIHSLPEGERPYDGLSMKEVAVEPCDAMLKCSVSAVPEEVDDIVFDKVSPEERECRPECAG